MPYSCGDLGVNLSSLLSPALVMAIKGSLRKLALSPGSVELNSQKKRTSLGSELTAQLTLSSSKSCASKKSSLSVAQVGVSASVIHLVHANRNSAPMKAKRERENTETNAKQMRLVIELFMSK